MSENKDINRQAVVIIHGMGEQRPNATIRGFMRCLMEEIGGDPDKLVFEKPDKMSVTYETRSKTIVADPAAGRPTTHIYEFYWAQHMRDSTWGQVLRWLGRLLYWAPSAVPPRLRKLYYTLWVILVATMAVVLLDRFTCLFNWYRRLTWLGALMLGALYLARSAIVNSLGDAARYMSDSPDNIAQRQAIREEGIGLLRHLHQAKDEKEAPLFGRIIVVAHSLGTVVAYDLLRLAWALEYSETCDQVKLCLPENEALTKMEADGYRVGPGFQQDQYECWKAQREAGNPWLVTDLVTMGSPLAYFPYLIVGSKREFERRRDKEREYPACPPVPDPYKKWHWEVFRQGKTPDTYNLLSYSSLFGCVRWTNLYFKTDFIGGPLNDVLGPGIVDEDNMKVPGQRLKTMLPFPFGHTNYWSDKRSKYKAMDKIIAAMHLNCNNHP